MGEVKGRRAVKHVTWSQVLKNELWLNVTGEPRSKRQTSELRDGAIEYLFPSPVYDGLLVTQETGIFLMLLECRHMLFQRPEGCTGTEHWVSIKHKNATLRDVSRTVITSTIQCFSYFSVHVNHPGASLKWGLSSRRSVPTDPRAHPHLDLCWVLKGGGSGFHFSPFLALTSCQQRCLLRSLAYFFSLFSYCWILRVLCQFGVAVLYQICLFLQMFFPVYGLFSWHCFSQKFLIYRSPSCQYFSSEIVPLVSYIKKSPPYPKSFAFSFILSSRAFRFLCFTFRSMTHFGLIFMSRFFLFVFACGCPVPCVGDYLCSIVLSLLLCQRSVDHIYVGSSLGWLFCFINICVYVA